MNLPTECNWAEPGEIAAAIERDHAVYKARTDDAGYRQLMRDLVTAKHAVHKATRESQGPYDAIGTNRIALEQKRMREVEVRLGIRKREVRRGRR